MRERPRIAWLTAAVALAVVSLSAQQEPTFRTKTQLVRVDAVVVDQANNPIHGLTADDFTLFDRGQPETVATFEEIHHAAPPAPTARPLGHRDVASNVVDDTGELMVIVLDDFHIRKEWTEHAREIIKDFVNDLGENVMVAMLSTTGKYNVELTTDHARILDAIDHFSGGEYKLAYHAAGGDFAVPGAPHPSPGLTAEEIARFHIDFPTMAAPAMASSVGGCGGSLEGVPDDSATLFRLLENASHILGSDDRRHKAFAWVSTGEAFQAEGLLDAVDAMRRAGVATYAIDPVGTGNVIPGGVYGVRSCGGRPRPTPWQVSADNRHASLTRTAHESGGEAVIEDDDLAAGVKRIVDDFGDYYVLGFYPDDVTTPGVRAIEVKVKQLGLRVRSRMSYTLVAPTTDKPKDPLVSMVGALAPTGDLPLRLYAAALPPSSPAMRGGRVLVTLEITAPVSALATPTRELADEFKYGVFAVDLDKGSVVRETTSDAKFTMSARGPDTPEHVAYAVETSLTLPAGHYQLRASATSQRVGTAGSVYLTLDVPDAHQGPIAMSDLILGESRVPVAQSTDGRTLQAVRSLPFAPTLDREFARTDSPRVYAEVLASHPKAPLDAVISVVDAAGRVAWTSRAAVAAKPLGRVDTHVPLASIAPGSYLLRVTASDGTNTVKREIGIVVR